MSRTILVRIICCLLFLSIMFSMIACSNGGNDSETNGETTADDGGGNIGTGGEEKMVICDLRTQNLEGPLGIQTRKPVFSWKLTSNERNQKQTAYRIIAASTAEKLKSGDYDVWDSGKVDSSDNYGIVYGGADLSSMQGVYWSVKVWDRDGEETAFSDAAYFETGLLNQNDWQAKWIGAGTEKVLEKLMPDKVGEQTAAGFILADAVGATTAQFLRINVSETGPAALGEYNDAGLGGVIYRLQIMELELYLSGEKVEIPKGTAVTAANSFSYGSQWNKDNLIDGNTTQGYTSNTAASPVYASPIEIILDFKEALTYDEIRLVCRTDSTSTDGDICPNYPKKYYYETSDDGSAFTVLGSEIEVTNAPTISGSSGDVTNAPILSKEFSVDSSKTVASARLYISGLGLFEAHVNGKILGEGTYFNPGESDARDTVYYCTYDITDILNDGSNAVSFLLGNGQYANYRIHRQFGRYYKTDDARTESEVRGMFGTVKGIAQVVVTYTDGSRDIIGTDNTWAYVESPITENSWYGGEDYDATLEIDGWDDVDPAIARSEWGKASLVSDKEIPKGELVGREFEPIAIQNADTVSSDKITVTKKSEKDGYTTYLVDMGRNGAGFPQITVNTNTAGQVIRMYPAEVDTFDGFEGHINQASCTQSASNNGDLIYDTYITKGAGEETYHPRFCYHGYRYVEVVVPSEIEISNKNFTGYILRTDNAKNGSFTSSDEILNQINTLTERSIESNMYHTFTDCPQIEKLGWLETPSLMFNSMAHTYDISSWIPKIIRDMVDAQYKNGRIAAIAPEYFMIGGLYDDLNWNGSIIFTAWQYYETYGNAEIFSDMNYTAMKKYMDYLEKYVAKNNLITTGQMGEWGEMTQYGTTPVVLVETTAYYRMATTMAKIAEVKGEVADVSRYSELAEAIKTAFHKNKECYNEKNLYGNGTQSGYGCVLYSGIVLDENREEALNRLVAAIEKVDYHLTSGEVGLRQVFSSLAEGGRSDVIYKMVMNDSMPSYKYFIDKGLTTLPEYWNFEELWWGMARSRNHAMMGHVKEWFTKYLAGISAVESGYDVIDIKPSVIDELTSVSGTIDSVHGTITSAWEYDPVTGAFTLNLMIPVGVTANVYIPVHGEGKSIQSDGETVETTLTEDGRYMLVSEQIGSGSYTFTVSGK